MNRNQSEQPAGSTGTARRFAPLRRALLVFGVLAGSLSANSIYVIPSGFTDSDGPVSGSAVFSVSDCVAGVNPSCTLNIAITDTQANPTGAGQLISGLSFQLLNAGTPLSGTGTLSGSINNDSNGDGTGGAVTVVNPDLSTSTTTTTPARWKFGTVAQQGQGSAGFDLTTLTGGSPQYMIMGPGPYSSANSSVTGHSPSLAGTVDFSITGFSGLTASTSLSAVEFFFGTGPDASKGLTCTSNCGSIGGTATPEPFSLALAGGGLCALGFLRRRAAVNG